MTTRLAAKTMVTDDDENEQRGRTAAVLENTSSHVVSRQGASDTAQNRSHDRDRHTCFLPVLPHPTFLAGLPTPPPYLWLVVRQPFPCYVPRP